MPVRFFPVSGTQARNVSDFGAVRGGGTRGHQGNDIMAPDGTPLVAVDDGEVRFGSDPLGGQIAVVYADDGTHYYYAHLQGFAGSAPRRVNAGEVIGYVGRTGNAASTDPHLHFEVHPCPRGSRCAVDPAPLINSAPRAGAGGVGPAGGGVSSQLRTLAILTLVGVGAWAALNPRDASRLVRRYSPIR